MIMTPEEVEARFQRIEAILAQTAEQNTERYQQIETILALNAEQNIERDRRSSDLSQQMDLMAIGINRLLESSTEYRLWKVETDQRFNVLLEEVRSINRRVVRGCLIKYKYSLLL